MRMQSAPGFPARVWIVLGVVGAMLIGFLILTSSVELSIKGNSLASISATPTGKKIAPPTATLTGSPAARRTLPPTQTIAVSKTPTQVASRIPSATATLTFTVPAVTPSPPSGTPVGSRTPSLTPLVSPTASLTATVPSTSTIVPAPTASPSAFATGTMTGTLTIVPTPTSTLGTTASSIIFAANSNESWVAPGDRTNYTLVFTNTSALPVTIALASSDNPSGNFSSSLSQTTLTLPARGAAMTTLVVSAGAKANSEPVNDTSVVATINGVERGKLKFRTRLFHIAFGRAFKGMGVSEHSIAPSTRVDVQLGVSTLETISAAMVTEYIPRAWTVADAGGGTLSAVNADTQKIEWSVASLAAGAIVTRTYALLSPAAFTPALQYPFNSTLTVSDYTVRSNPWQVLVEHPLGIKHYRIGQNTGLDHMNYIAALDEPARGISLSDTFRVRFSVSNSQATPVRWKPRLEWSLRSNRDFKIVPAGLRAAGQPFYIRPLSDLSNGQLIPVAFFGLGQPPLPVQPGALYTNENPGPVLTLGASSTTEIEFSLHATLDAMYNASYYFQLSDDDRPMSGKIAQIEIGGPLPLQLTQPQFAGIGASPGSALSNSAAPRAPAATSPHGSYSNLADQCASCHRVHTSQNRNLLSYVPAQSNLCFACHNGTGATSNIKSQYSDPTVPANNSTTSTFYSHSATAATSHTNAANDEFKGVLNRHSECGDCHNPHSGDTSLTASTAAGFTTSGALKNITGVDTNNAWKGASTYEYELCYKCHSNYTVLLSYTKPSYKMLDQAAEFNPGNASFHPIESAGKNATAAMAASLAGTSPYKLWNFTVGSVMRCENCHGDYRLANPASPPAANARNASHTSKFANILMNNYRDRLLKSANEAYAAADFALCYQCHAEAPFASGGGGSTATNFRLHSKHMTDIGGRSPSTDIDTPGAGPGRAICAECHYRTHGQGTNAAGNLSGARLVNFAPNITASGNGQLSWDPTTRTCYLTCHGDNHNPERY